MSSGISRITSERNQRNLLELTKQPGNDVCADCKSRNPRWASHNLGIFICVNCASIHRKLGTHITKVKSITLDSWTKEQVEIMRQNGNIKSNNLYNPDEARHPPPTNMMEAERDSEIEKFIRAKYEFKWYMNCKPSQFTSPARSSSNPVAARSVSIPTTVPAPVKRKPSPTPPPVPAKNITNGGIQSFNVATRVSPLGPTAATPMRSVSQPQSVPDFSAPIQKRPGNQVWEDLISLQGPAQTSSLPLQYQPPNFSTPPPSLPSQSHTAPPSHPFNASPNPFTTLQGSYLPTSMPSMNNPSSVASMHIAAGGPTSPQTPFRQQYSGYPFPNTLESTPPQMGIGGMNGTPGVTSLPQQNYFGQSFGQPPQSALSHIQDPNMMYPHQQSHTVQQQYSPQPSFGATPGFVEQQQPVFTPNMAYGWQNMHGNFQ